MAKSGAATATLGGEAPSQEKRARGRKRVPVVFDSFSDIADQWRRERPDLDLDSMLMNIAVTRVERLLTNYFETAYQMQFGIAISEARLLFALRRSGRPYASRPTDLFRALIVTSGAITKQVNRLVSKGLVGRTSDPLHAGGFLIHLTPKGLKVANQAAEYLVQHSTVSKALGKWSSGERQRALQLMERLLDALEEAGEGQPYARTLRSADQIAAKK